MISRKVCKSFC